MHDTLLFYYIEKDDSNIGFSIILFVSTPKLEYGSTATVYSYKRGYTFWEYYSIADYTI